MLQPRHVQDHGGSNTTEIHYWAYPSRILPCTSGKGSCEYLDAVYWMHQTSMLYTFIMWAVFGGILAFCLFLRYSNHVARKSDIRSPLKRGFEAIRTFGRRWLLPESPGRWFFGRVTMLQVAMLLTLSAYLLIFSLVGIVYKTWVTPVKKHPGVYNTRVGMGGFADRVGAMAYALTPFTIALCTRESLLSLITGVPYQHFNFLHRWTGRIIFIQSFLHTLGWTIIEGNLYRPQPSVYKDFIKQQYIVFGIVAQIFITFLYIFSTSWAIRWTGYEFFKRSHYVIAILYLGACWGHWDGLACWMIASLILLFLDKGARIIRTALLHFGYFKGSPKSRFQCATATLQYFGDGSSSEKGDGEVLRIDFDFAQDAWSPGQHFYLCFPAFSVWQSHPFTPSSLPDVKSAVQHHTYLVRVRSGITAQLARFAKEGQDGTAATTPVILCGPYPGSDGGDVSSNLLAVAGGTGVTSVLPVVQKALSATHAVSRAIDLVWIVRYARDLDWLYTELSELKAMAKNGRAQGLRMRIFVTREGEGEAASTTAEKQQQQQQQRRQSNEQTKRAKGKGIQRHSNHEKQIPSFSITTTHSSPSPSQSSNLSLTSASENFEIHYLAHTHPSIDEIIQDFSDRASLAGGSSRVIGSGPAAIGTALRRIVAERNREMDVWRGDEGAELSLEWDCHS